MILGESVEDFGHRINTVGVHDETMQRVVMIAKLKFMKANSEYSKKAELWEFSENSPITAGAPSDATEKEKTEQEYLAAEGTTHFELQEAYRTRRPRTQT